MLSSTFIDDAGRPSFNSLQNFGSPKTPIVYYVFDLLVLGGRDIRSESLAVRRELLQEHVLPELSEPVRESPVLEAGLSDLIAAVRAQGLEGLVAKRPDSGTSRVSTPVLGKRCGSIKPSKEERLSQ